MVGWVTCCTKGGRDKGSRTPSGWRGSQLTNTGSPSLHSLWTLCVVCLYYIICLIILKCEPTHARVHLNRLVFAVAVPSLIPQLPRCLALSHGQCRAPFSVQSQLSI